MPWNVAVVKAWWHVTHCLPSVSPGPNKNKRSSFICWQPSAVFPKRKIKQKRKGTVEKA
jgi:hypothetical protein